MSSPERRRVVNVVIVLLGLGALLAVVLSVVSAFDRNEKTRRALRALCDYQRANSLQGNARVRYLRKLGRSHETLLDTAASARERPLPGCPT